MIAEAIKEQNPHFARILVDLQTIRWTNTTTGKRYICLTPEEAAAKLVDFDQGRPIEAFTFDMRIVQVTNAKKGARGRKKLDAQMTIQGGTPIRTAHLKGSDVSGGAEAEAQRKRRDRSSTNTGAVSGEDVGPPEGASNIVRSSRAYRSYGRRLLKG
jgi:hypothetical protein